MQSQNDLPLHPILNPISLMAVTPPFVRWWGPSPVGSWWQVSPGPWAAVSMGHPYGDWLGHCGSSLPLFPGIFWCENEPLGGRSLSYSALGAAQSGCYWCSLSAVTPWASFLCGDQLFITSTNHGPDPKSFKDNGRESAFLWALDQDLKPSWQHFWLPRRYNLATQNILEMSPWNACVVKMKVCEVGSHWRRWVILQINKASRG